MFRNYFKVSLRALRKQSGYSFINIAGLTLGLACCMLIFQYVTFEYSFDTFNKNIDNIYRIHWTRSQNDDQLENALIAARKAVSMDSNYANAHEYLGSILMAKGNRDLARDSYRTALELNPYKPDLHVLVGWEEALGGDWANGIEKIERGISIDPNPAAWMRIPLALDAFRRNDFPASLYQSELMIESGDGRGVVEGAGPGG